MARDYDPVQGQWYEDLEENEIFKVLSVDPDEEIIEIQYENGDIEDYWIVGGTTYGAAYDALRMLGGAFARYGRAALLTETYRAHLDEIVAKKERDILEV